MPGQLRFPSSLSTTVAALVRRHFALTQAELGQWLGVSQATIEAVEAGRRQLSARPDARLGRLHSLLALPPEPTPEPPPEPPPLTPAQAAAAAGTWPPS